MKKISTNYIFLCYNTLKGSDYMVIKQTPFQIYNFMIIISIIVGCTYIFLSLRNNIDNKKLIIFFIFYFIFALLFGKLYTFIAYGFKASFLKSGLSAYGGLIGTIIWAFIYEKIYPNDGKVVKHTILALPLIYSFTKIGCFFTGCCHGFVYNGLFAVNYPERSDDYYFPVQLIEVIIFFVMFLVCNTFKDKKNIVYITIVLVAIAKFLVEFLRDVEVINANQIFSIALLFITVLMYIKKSYLKN